MDITTATSSDFEIISQWLEEEFNKNGEGFYVNIEIIKDYFKKKELFVYRENDFPVGFVTGPLSGPDILSVKENFRKKGIGKALFEHILKKVHETNLNNEGNIVVLEIQCAPKSSISFWRKMGFSVQDSIGYGRIIYGYRAIEYQNESIPGEDIEVILSSYNESKLYDENVPPILTIKAKGIKDKDGRISFKERIIFLRERDNTLEDLVLSISVDGYESCKEKAKHLEELGVNKSSTAFYIDKLDLKELITT